MRENRILGSHNRKGLDRSQTLTSAERTQFEAMMVFAFNSEENFFLLRRMGFIDDTLWAGGRTFYFRWLLKHEEPAEWWLRNRKMFGGAFCDYVDGFRRQDAGPEGDDVDRP